MRSLIADGASLTAGNISGGTLNVFSQGGETLGKLTADEISSAFNYNGGDVTATTISGATNLNWTNANDTINVTAYTGTFFWQGDLHLREQNRRLHPY